MIKTQTNELQLRKPSKQKSKPVAAFSERIDLFLHAIQGLAKQMQKEMNRIRTVEASEETAREDLQDRRWKWNYQLRRVGSVEEFVVDGERALLDGGSEVPTRLRSVLVVEGRERIERRQEIRRVDPRF